MQRRPIELFRMILRQLLRDRSAWSLLFANLAVIAIAHHERWDAMTTIWIYYFQNLIIGAFNVLRLVDMGRAVGGRSGVVRYFLPGFFLLHYGLFHAIYAIFLSSEETGRRSSADWGLILASVGLFFANHAYSYFKNRALDRAATPGTLMKAFFFPYARIIPMHFIILLAGLLGEGGGVLVVFLLLKTAADLLMHAIEHADTITAPATFVRP